MLKGSQASEETKQKLRDAWKHRIPASDATKLKISESGRKRFADPLAREAHRNNLNNPITRKRMSESAKKRCTPEWRKCKSEIAKKQMSNPEIRESISQKFRDRLADPSWVRKRRCAYDKPEYRRKMSNVRYKIREQFIETIIGGFWYGNVKHYDTPQYCEKFNKEFKERVRAFWGYVCFECGSPQNGKGLHVHHVHYDKKMCCNGSPQDVVPLCQSCHNKTLCNRDYWEDYFTELLYAYDPNGKCFFTKDEMLQFSGGSI